MLFNIGVSVPANKNEAYGITVPIFEKLGYGCVSAADTEQEILNQAKDAIYTMAEELLLDGIGLEQLDEYFHVYSDQEKHSDFDHWLWVEVDLSDLKGKPQRINISLPDTLIRRVDSFVEKSGKFKDRSHFLAIAAQNEITQQ